MLVQNVSTKASYGPTWAALIWDEDDLTDKADMISYYAYFLGLSTTPVARRSWTLHEGRMEVFDEYH